MAGQSILIAAFSGRAAGMAARRSGFAPLVADLFADADTADIAAGLRKVAGDPATGFDPGGLMAALEALSAAAPSPLIGLAYGAGFEDRPGLLAEIAARWPLLGNAPETVAAVKDPWRLAETLATLGIAHPEIREKAGPDAGGWLVKRRGGAGGIHVSPGRAGAGSACYAQRRIRGRSVSALFLAGAKGVAVVGFSEQWTAPSPGQPFRFGGAAAPAAIAPPLAAELTEAVRKTARAFGLQGLNSADFIVGPEGPWLIEINPRLGATLDLFDDGERCLFAAHLAALRGEDLAPIPPPAGARGLAIAYAPAAIERVPRLQWPDWIADRPPPGIAIPAQAPLCTILASAATASEARSLCHARAGQALQLIGSGQWTTTSPASPVPA